MIPDIEVSEGVETGPAREVFCFPLPDHFDRAAVQAAHDQVETRLSFASPWTSIFFLLFFGLLIAAIGCVFFSGTRLLALGFFLASLAFYLLFDALDRFTGRLSKAKAPMSSQLHEYVTWRS